MKFKTIIFSALMCTLPFHTTHSKGLELGSPAPQLEAVNQDNKTIDLGEIFSSGITLLYFYPKAGTPGCTAQACSLRDNYDSLVEDGVTVLGVSSDSPKSQKKFKEKYQLPFDLIADKDKRVAKAFQKSGWFSRQAYLIHNGIIVWQDLSASTTGQASDVEKAMETLGLTK